MSFVSRRIASVGRVGERALMVLALAGCGDVFDLEVVQPPAVGDGEPNTYTCVCSCTYKDGGVSSVALDVCNPPGTNPNTGGTAPDAAALVTDCQQRVETQIEAMSDVCYAANRPRCECEAAAGPVTFFDESCDRPCGADPLDAACADWNPETGATTANCADAATCADPGPVCLREGTPTPSPGAAGLAAALMAPLTTCVVDDGTMRVSAGDHSDSTGMAGVIHFAPACLPGGTCLVMDYRLDATSALEFDGFLGFGDVEISGIKTAGAAEPFALAAGAGLLAAETTFTSGIAREDGDHRAAVGANASGVTVSLDGAACALQGSLLGGVGDPDGDNEDFSVEVNVAGTVENTPPVASMGGSRSEECTGPDGALVDLDGSSSTDAQDDIVSYGWYGDTRAGEDLGAGVSVQVQQAKGSRTYVLKVIDAWMAADEVASTVSVVDTTVPVIACNAPATIVPRRAPYVFTATAEDACDDGLAAPTITDVSCYALNGQGKIVERACDVRVEGASLVIRDSGGVGDMLEWTVRSADADGNTRDTVCTTTVVRPGPGPL